MSEELTEMRLEDIRAIHPRCGTCASFVKCPLSEYTGYCHNWISPRVVTADHYCADHEEEVKE